jgi:hypothetical protein
MRASSAMLVSHDREVTSSNAQQIGALESGGFEG